jgi:putative thiamine transport system permease protein
MVWSAWCAAQAGWDRAAWLALFEHPQTLAALGMSLWTGLMSTALAVAGAAFLLSRTFGHAFWPRGVRWLAPLLAVPHAAFAIGLVFLLAPSGWVLRALSPWATGLDAPPPWPTTQDPWGLGLIAVLVFKEIPFLLWAAATQLQRAEVAQRWTRELQLARSMGYSAPSAWWRVVWPQLWPRLRWPLLAVLAYSLTVVDMALVIGPSTPPTLAVLAWQWLLDGDPAVNALGACAAWALAAVLALTTGLAAWVWPVPQRALWRRHWTQGTRGRCGTPTRWGVLGFGALLGVYGAVMLSLLVGSVAGLWPFPQLLPQALTWQAWATVGGSLPTVGTTLSLALASAVAALIWSVAWLEYAPPAWDRPLRPLLYLPLVLPPVLWVVGVHGLTLRLGWDGRWTGLWLAHTLAAVPYVLIALSPAYLGFDARHQQVCASLGHGRAVFLWRVKWPLLRAALSAGLAIGFAVSVAQYLPTLFVGGGRFATVTTEAVTGASGAQRSLTSAYALLQWGLPLLLWAWAAHWGRPRRFKNPDNGSS